MLFSFCSHPPTGHGKNIQVPQCVPKSGLPLCRGVGSQTSTAGLRGVLVPDRFVGVGFYGKVLWGFSYLFVFFF